MGIMKTLRAYWIVISTCVAVNAILGLYYMTGVDAFLVLALLGAAGGFIGQFLIGKTGSLMNTWIYSIVLANLGFYIWLELYLSYMWFPLVMVLPIVLVMGGLPWVPKLLSMAPKKELGDANTTPTAVTADSTQANTTIAQNPLIKLFSEFLAFVGGGSLFYGTLSFMIIVCLSGIYWAFIDLNKVSFFVFVILFCAACMVSRIATTQQKRETAEPAKEDKAPEPDKKS